MAFVLLQSDRLGTPVLIRDKMMDVNFIISEIYQKCRALIYLADLDDCGFWQTEDNNKQ